MRPPSFINLFALLFAVFSSGLVTAQKTLVVPLTVNFLEADVMSSANLLAVLSGDENAAYAMLGNEEENAAYAASLKHPLEEMLRPAGNKMTIVAKEDLKEETIAELHRLELLTFGATKSGSIIGKKQYQNQMGELVAPLVNRLCDKFDVDQVLFVQLQLMNTKKKGKEPAGSITVAATMIDGNSGLVIEKETKNKNNGKFNAEVIVPLIEKVVKAYL